MHLAGWHRVTGPRTGSSPDPTRPQCCLSNPGLPGGPRAWMSFLSTPCPGASLQPRGLKHHLHVRIPEQTPPTPGLCFPSSPLPHPQCLPWEADAQPSFLVHCCLTTPEARAWTHSRVSSSIHRPSRPSRAPAPLLGQRRRARSPLHPELESPFRTRSLELHLHS